MKKIVLLVLGIIFSVGVITAKITPTEVGMLDFSVVQNLSYAEMNGTMDVTEKLQTAINNAVASNKSLYIPSGTYLVSKTITCTAKLKGTKHSAGEGAVVIIGSGINPPLIKLADNSIDFQGTGMPNQTNGPNAVFELTNDEYPTKKANWIYFSGIRNLHFNLGNENPGAVAISWACHQDCFLEDIVINATGAWGGIAGIPGANSHTYNVTVDGGRYGIYSTKNDDAVTLYGHSIGHNIIGCKLFNQTEYAMRLHGWGGLTIVGLEITKVSGTAIWLRGSNNPNDCPIAIVDSKIEFDENSSTNRFLDNSGKATVSLIDLYTFNCQEIAFNNNDDNLYSQGQRNDWNHIEKYHFVDKSSKTNSDKVAMQGVHFINNQLTNSTYLIRKMDVPPVNLCTKHIVQTNPNFEDDDIFLVKSGNTDDRLTIQNAINNHKRVMLCAGKYYLNGPVILKDSTVLFGCPGMWTILAPSADWKPTQPVWLVETEDNSEATSYLMEIAFELDPNLNYWGAIHWRSGRESVVRRCAVSRGYGGNEGNLQKVKISGNGGGRWYNFGDHKKHIKDPKIIDDRHRKILISGTTQPLTFYSFNLERGGGFHDIVSSYPMCEIVNSKNIRTFGSKSETYQPYFKITDSENIQIFNVQDWAIYNKFKTNQHLIILDGDCKNIEICNAQWNNPPDESYKIVKDNTIENTPSRLTHMGIFKNGHFDKSPFQNIGSDITSIRSARNTSGVMFYPNPTSDGSFTIESDNHIGMITIADILGKTIMGLYVDGKTGNITIKNRGIYLASFNGGTQKLLY